MGADDLGREGDVGDVFGDATVAGAVIGTASGEGGCHFVLREWRGRF